ncbi:hypothetical protein ACLKA6_012865 [Drosophila palustris]
MTGHSWSMKEPLIIQRNTHLGDDNQQQQQQHWRQQQQLWRSPHPTVSNCHYHGKSVHEAIKRLLLPLEGIRKPSLSAPAGTTTSTPAAAAVKLAILHAITVATEAASDANGRICSTAPVGHNTPDAQLGHLNTIFGHFAAFALAMAKAASSNNTTTQTQSLTEKKKSSSSSVEGLGVFSQLEWSTGYAEIRRSFQLPRVDCHAYEAATLAILIWQAACNLLPSLNHMPVPLAFVSSRLILASTK